MQAVPALTTRRTLFAAATIFPFAAIAAAPVVAKPDTWGDWMTGYGVVAQDPEMRAIMREAHRQGFRPDQVHAVTFKENGVRLASIQLEADDGDQVQIWRNCTLRAHGKRGEV